MTIRKRLFIAILPALLPAFLLAGCAMFASAGIEDARKQHVAQDFAATRLTLIEVLNDEPNDAAALLLMADTLIRLRDPEGALAMVERLKSAGKTDAAVARLQAEAVLMNGKAEQAQTLLGSDNHADAWRIRAAAFLFRKDAAKAIDAFERGMAMGGNVRIAADYAYFRMSVQDIEFAEKIHARMARIAPTAFETLMVGGRLGILRFKVDMALRDYRKATEIYPKRIEPMIALAEVLESAGQLDAALVQVKRAHELDQRGTAVRDMEIRILAMKGDWPKIRSMLQSEESSLDPQSPTGLTYGEALLRLGQAEQARALFARTILLAPQNRYARMMLGEAQLASGDAAAAFKTLKPFTETVLLHPSELELTERAARAANDPIASSLRLRKESAQFKRESELAIAGNKAMARMDWAGAVRIYQQIPGHQGDAEVLKRLALASSKAGSHDAAIGFADRAMAISTYDPMILYIGGLVRMEGSRNRDEGLALLRRAVQASPYNIEFKTELAKAEAAAG